MKNNLNTTEELLKKGKNVRLSVSERDEMKSALLSYAKYHGEKNKLEEGAYFSSVLWFRGFVSASLALVLFVGTGFASVNSLPGEFLYPVKTNVVEELVAVTKLTHQSQLEYQHERYETRVFELQTLLESGSLSVVALRDSRSNLLELSKEVVELMSDENEIDGPIALEFVGEMVAMGNATEELVRDNVTEELQNDFENITDDLVEVHSNEIVDLLETGTSTIESYIKDQLSDISEKLSEENLDDVATSRVADYVEDAETSLQSQNYKDVVNLISDAVILIKSEEYIDNYQDEILD